MKTTVKADWRQSRVSFEAISDHELVGLEVSDLQVEAGYHPLGYGGPNGIHSIKRNDGTWLTSWSCYGSCD